jgi:hypothetical protein
MIIIPMVMFPIYIKKEDARDVVMWQRKGVAFVLVAVTLVMAIIQFIVSPKLLDFYSSLNMNPPAIVESSFNIMLALISILSISALYLLFSVPDYARIDAAARRYKHGEMIKTKELVDNKYQWLILGSLVLMVAYLLYTTILPIYNLIGQY